MVVVDKMSKVAHFIVVKYTHKAIDIGYIFMKEIFNCMVYLRKLS